ncbi:hexosaminidase [Catalinimonas alkaloidigena]|uniref:beta-N-acetylhexosaminidase n=1 Tax=Catalinimonas alkaloidigena TaxID=1075417 RepID=A0A1G8YFC2_9BACT|nr:family 20 glycosylhydrolase [Catalinimonas alkaloidigena]SDK01383.1 hexosaminidase [Catalinimonas alkaloidigena]
MRFLVFRIGTMLCLLLWCGAGVRAQSPASPPLPLIPYPASVQTGRGTFILSAETRLVIPKKGLFAREADQLQQLMARALGQPLRTAKKGNTQVLVLQQATDLTKPEAYRLQITPERVVLSAQDPAGMFRAIQTLRQLLPVEAEQGGLAQMSLPAVTLEDAPRFSWRGLHLDVSRHFFGVEYVYKLLDLMALYKFNKLHLHLTDDQGWRIEIKQYPKLTEEGAWRTFNNQDSVVMERAKENPDFEIDPQHIVKRDGKVMYGGFYTQDQMRQIIDYAAARHIEIIPEIDMPGHMMAAIQAYPFLTCTESAGWGKTFSVPICPCDERVLTFAENVYREIIDLFPSSYIHLGADEVEKTTWAQSAACQALMQREQLESVEELQSYFVHHMQRFFHANGKKLIGWDEVLEGGIDSSATIMYWRSWVKDAPLKAAQNGNPIIMTPVGTLYFDYAPDQNSLDKVYHMPVVPADFTAQQATQVLGAQANLWTEYVPSEARADFMYMPRMTALAENVWTNRDLFTSYEQRLVAHYPRLARLGVHYRVPDLTGFTESNVFTEAATLTVHKPLDNLTLHYTTDGSRPDRNSPTLTGPLRITRSDTIKVAATTPEGLIGETYTIRYRKETFAEPVAVAAPQPGLQVSYFPAYFRNTKGFADSTATQVTTAPQLEVPALVTAPSFGLKFRGYLEVPATGIYSFFFTCDDGGVLRIADRVVVDNDGQHGPVEKSGQVALKKGRHPFAVDFLEAGGGYTLKLEVQPEGQAPQPVPASWFSH